MTIEPEMLMAYADGVLDPLNAKRVERAIAADPALGEDVARHRRLKARLAEAYAPIGEEPVPDRLAAMLSSNVVPLSPRSSPRSRLSRPVWRSAAADWNTRQKPLSSARKLTAIRTGPSPPLACRSRALASEPCA